MSVIVIRDGVEQVWSTEPGNSRMQARANAVRMALRNLSGDVASGPPEAPAVDAPIPVTAAPAARGGQGPGTRVVLVAGSAPPAGAGTRPRTGQREGPTIASLAPMGGKPACVSQAVGHPVRPKQAASEEKAFDLAVAVPDPSLFRPGTEPPTRLGVRFLPGSVSGDPVSNAHLGITRSVVDVSGRWVSNLGKVGVVDAVGRVFLRHPTRISRIQGSIYRVTNLSLHHPGDALLTDGSEFFRFPGAPECKPGDGWLVGDGPFHLVVVVASPFPTEEATGGVLGGDYGMGRFGVTALDTYRANCDGLTEVGAIAVGDLHYADLSAGVVCTASALVAATGANPYPLIPPQLWQGTYEIAIRFSQDAIQPPTPSRQQKKGIPTLTARVVRRPDTAGGDSESDYSEQPGPERLFRACATVNRFLGAAVFRVITENDRDGSAPRSGWINERSPVLACAYAENDGVDEIQDGVNQQLVVAKERRCAAWEVELAFSGCPTPGEGGYKCDQGRRWICAQTGMDPRVQTVDGFRKLRKSGMTEHKTVELHAPYLPPMGVLWMVPDKNTRCATQVPKRLSAWSMVEVLLHALIDPRVFATQTARLPRVAVSDIAASGRSALQSIEALWVRSLSAHIRSGAPEPLSLPSTKWRVSPSHPRSHDDRIKAGYAPMASAPPASAGRRYLLRDERYRPFQGASASRREPVEGVTRPIVERFRSNPIPVRGGLIEDLHLCALEGLQRSMDARPGPLSDSLTGPIRVKEFEGTPDAVDPVWVPAPQFPSPGVAMVVERSPGKFRKGPAYDGGFSAGKGLVGSCPTSPKIRVVAFRWDWSESADVTPPPSRGVVIQPIHLGGLACDLSLSWGNEVGISVRSAEEASEDRPVTEPPAPGWTDCGPPRRITLTRDTRLPSALWRWDGSGYVREPGVDGRGEPHLPEEDGPDSAEAFAELERAIGFACRYPTCVGPGKLLNISVTEEGIEVRREGVLPRTVDPDLKVSASGVLAGLIRMSEFSAGARVALLQSSLAYSSPSGQASVKAFQAALIQCQALGGSNAGFSLGRIPMTADEMAFCSKALNKAPLGGSPSQYVVPPSLTSTDPTEFCTPYGRPLPRHVGVQAAMAALDNQYPISPSRLCEAPNCGKAPGPLPVLQEKGIPDPFPGLCPGCTRRVITVIHTGGGNLARSRRAGGAHAAALEYARVEGAAVLEEFGLEASVLGEDTALLSWVILRVAASRVVGSGHRWAVRTIVPAPRENKPRVPAIPNTELKALVSLFNNICGLWVPFTQLPLLEGPTARHVGRFPVTTHVGAYDATSSTDGITHDCLRELGKWIQARLQSRLTSIEHLVALITDYRMKDVSPDDYARRGAVEAEDTEKPVGVSRVDETPWSELEGIAAMPVSEWDPIGGRIFDALKAGHCVIAGETGSGKTSRLPGLLLAGNRTHGMRSHVLLPTVNATVAALPGIASFCPDGTVIRVAHSGTDKWYAVTSRQARETDHPVGVIPHVVLSTPLYALRCIRSSREGQPVQSRILIFDEAHEVTVLRYYVLSQVIAWGGRVAVVSATLDRRMSALFPNRIVLPGRGFAADRCRAIPRTPDNSEVVVAMRDLGTARNAGGEDPGRLRAAQLRVEAAVRRVPELDRKLGVGWDADCRLSEGRCTLVIAESVRHADELTERLRTLLPDRKVSVSHGKIAAELRAEGIQPADIVVATPGVARSSVTIHGVVRVVINRLTGHRTSLTGVTGDTTPFVDDIRQIAGRCSRQGQQATIVSDYHVPGATASNPDQLPLKQPEDATALGRYRREAFGEHVIALAPFVRELSQGVLDGLATLGSLCIWSEWYLLEVVSTARALLRYAERRGFSAVLGTDYSHPGRVSMSFMMDPAVIRTALTVTVAGGEDGEESRGIGRAELVVQRTPPPIGWDPPCAGIGALLRLGIRGRAGASRASRLAYTASETGPILSKLFAGESVVVAEVAREPDAVQSFPVRVETPDLVFEPDECRFSGLPVPKSEGLRTRGGEFFRFGETLEGRPVAPAQRLTEEAATYEAMPGKEHQALRGLVMGAPVGSTLNLCNAASILVGIRASEGRAAGYGAGDDAVLAADVFGVAACGAARSAMGLEPHPKKDVMIPYITGGIVVLCELYATLTLSGWAYVRFPTDAARSGRIIRSLLLGLSFETSILRECPRLLRLWPNHGVENFAEIVDGGPTDIRVESGVSSALGFVATANSEADGGVMIPDSVVAKMMSGQLPARLGMATFDNVRKMGARCHDGHVRSHEVQAALARVRAAKASANKLHWFLPAGHRLSDLAEAAGVEERSGAAFRPASIRGELLSELHRSSVRETRAAGLTDLVEWYE